MRDNGGKTEGFYTKGQMQRNYRRNGLRKYRGQNTPVGRMHVLCLFLFKGSEMCGCDLTVESDFE